jgi:hypothetical protein
MKKYMAPVTEIIYLEASSMICGSKGGREGQISDNSGRSPYQNADWYQYDPIEDDDGELNSQSKGNDVIVDDED